ncbi:hypothetical protein IAI10_11025 [Clostridium sp. 19966]|uniref:hypothetical protein n=1 Tax=Clostridium sp. 19966 TaxID=2768166 RepID=UPI0028DF06F4|nr:hypothetical protein [Clostridium sp. 19966]MDT8717189.1 hypothetical protein [Clostridium sp. 19966]
MKKFKNLIITDLATSAISIVNGVLNIIEKRNLLAFLWILLCAFWGGMAYIQYLNLKKHNNKIHIPENVEQVNM